MYPVDCISITHCALLLFLIQEITAQPVNPVTALEDVNLVCLSSVTDGVRYSWNRVNGGIPYKSRGRNSSVLMIPRAIPNDEGVYYCKASKNGISAESNKIVVKVNGKLWLLCINTNGILYRSIRYKCSA